MFTSTEVITITVSALELFIIESLKIKDSEFSLQGILNSTIWDYSMPCIKKLPKNMNRNTPQDIKWHSDAIKTLREDSLNFPGNLDTLLYELNSEGFIPDGLYLITEG